MSGTTDAAIDDAQKKEASPPQEEKKAPEPTVIDLEIKEYRRKIKRLNVIPRVLHPFISGVWMWGALQIIPKGDTLEEVSLTARKMRGHLERLGITPEIVKDKDSDGNDEMSLKWEAEGHTFNITGYMPKTCRRIVKMVDVAAEPEKVTPAKPAHQIEQVIIECDGLKSELVSERIVPAGEEVKKQVEEDLEGDALSKAGAEGTD